MTIVGKRVPQLRTTRVIADELGESVARVQAVLRAMPHIRPVARADHLRLYDVQAVEQIRQALQQIAPEARHAS